MNCTANRWAAALLACWPLLGCESKHQPQRPPDSSPAGGQTEMGYRADPDMGVLAGEWVDPVTMVSYRFAGTSLMVTRPGEPLQPLAYSLDSRERPKRITLRRPDGTTQYGVYDLVGKRLRVALAPPGDAAPAKVEAIPTCELWTLERAN